MASLPASGDAGTSTSDESRTTMGGPAALPSGVLQGDVVHTSVVPTGFVHSPIVHAAAVSPVVVPAVFGPQGIVHATVSKPKTGAAGADFPQRNLQRANPRPANPARANLERANSVGISLEVNRRKRLLNEQQETVAAPLETSQLQRDSIGKPLKSPPPPDPASPSDVLKLQQLVEEVQTVLDEERISHQEESSRASLRIAHLQEALDQKAQTGYSAWRRRNFKFSPRTLAALKAFITVAVLLGAAIGSYLTWKSNLFVAEALKVWDTREPPRKEPEPVAPAINIPPGSALSKLVVNTNSVDFSGALSRLDKDLNFFPKRDAQEILQSINQTKTASGAVPCDFTWTDGEPAVQFRGTPQSPSIIDSMNTCAEALESFRAKALEAIAKERQKAAESDR